MDQMIAGYRVLRPLGQGGMGSVYLVQNPRLPRQEALKLVAADLSVDDVFRARFEREADVLSKLNHPNIVHAYASGRSEGRLWLTMEFIDGPDAATLLDRYRRLPLAQVDDIVTGVAAALDYAWATQRLTHRDVKPANILVQNGMTGPAAVKLADFGVATGPDRTRLTQSGHAVGTLWYLAPEGLSAPRVDDRADQYSLACTAYHLITGYPPFGDRPAADMMRAHMTETVAPPSTLVPGLPPYVDAAITRAMAKDPAQRFESSTAFAAALRGVVPEAVTADIAGPLVRPPTRAMAPGDYAAEYAAAAAAASFSPPSGPGQAGAPPGGDGGRPDRKIGIIIGVVAAVLLVILLVGGLILYVTHRGGDSPAPVAVSSVTSSATSSAPSSSTTTSSVTSSATTSAAGASLAALDGAWTGTYTCNQGESALKLTFRDGGDRTTRATFEFGPTGSNPTVARGSYEMYGVRIGDTLTLTGTRWIDQPSGYQMVPLLVDGPFTTGMSRLTGTVPYTGCTSFSVTR
ncbi:serine/threonine-protein kinase [Gordonia sp. FQ]|uniref:serine/threonine-protein kinase n=1 Tax=Gordonia sp. FQ TaxID=3446634 RepID=UPI003F863FB0